jgi:hypothetical protein
MYYTYWFVIKVLLLPQELYNVMCITISKVN